MSSLNKIRIGKVSIGMIALLAISACTTASATASATAQQADVRVLASFPSGNFLENLEVQPDGRLLFTDYPNHGETLRSSATARKCWFNN